MATELMSIESNRIQSNPIGLIRFATVFDLFANHWSSDELAEEKILKPTVTCVLTSAKEIWTSLSRT